MHDQQAPRPAPPPPAPPPPAPIPPALTIAPDTFVRYQELQTYVGWTSDDRRLVDHSAAIFRRHFAELVADFYREIQLHPAAAAVIRGGQAQIDRLKRTLLTWLEELFAGPYDEAYVARRWRVGLRHVEISLPQVYPAAAMARLRSGLCRALQADWRGNDTELAATLRALNKLIDLDLAIISDAYETEHALREQVAERRRIDEALQREQEVSAGLFMHAGAAVLVVDQRGNIVRSNAMSERFASGKACGTLAGHDWTAVFLSAEEGGRVRALLALQSPGGELQPATASSIVETPQGHRQVHWSAVPLVDARGDRFAGLVLGHDVTDLYEAQRRALQAERLAAIGQMATGLAHESRNALQRIGASAEMLELELAHDAEALALVARIQQSQAQLHQLLEDVRSYAAPIVLDRSPLSITEPWREAWELLAAERKGRTAGLRELLHADHLMVDADRFRLVQVFRNLFDNSLAAADDPVAIDVTCEPASLRGLPGLRIRVRDNGHGLGAEERRRLFEPFFTTKPTGTGLGTAIAQRLVEAHGGTIEVGESSPSGTEIVLTLPAA